MSATIRNLYLSGALSDEGLQNAVTKKWITQEEADALISQKNQ